MFLRVAQQKRHFLLHIKKAISHKPQHDVYLNRDYKSCYVLFFCFHNVK